MKVLDSLFNDKDIGKLKFEKNKIYYNAQRDLYVRYPEEDENNKKACAKKKLDKEIQQLRESIQNHEKEKNK